MPVEGLEPAIHPLFQMIDALFQMTDAPSTPVDLGNCTDARQRDSTDTRQSDSTVKRRAP